MRTRSVAVAPSGNLPLSLKTDHGRQEHGGGLAEHARLGFNSSNAPADDAQAVDHGGVRIRADDGVRVGFAALVKHDGREVFEIDLVHDAGIGRDGAEILE